MDLPSSWAGTTHCVVPKNRVGCERRDEVPGIEYLVRFGAKPEHERVFVLGGIVPCATVAGKSSPCAS